MHVKLAIVLDAFQLHHAEQVLVVAGGAVGRQASQRYLLPEGGGEVRGEATKVVALCRTSCSAPLGRR